MYKSVEKQIEYIIFKRFYYFLSRFLIITKRDEIFFLIYGFQFHMFSFKLCLCTITCN